MEPGLLVLNIIRDYCSTRVLLYAKMLKETKNEETRLFCHIFIIGGISIGWGKGTGLPTTLAKPANVTSMLFVILRFFVLFYLFAFLHVKATLIVLFCMIIIIIFIYLPSDVISQEKTATSSRSITKASKYAIPLKPNTQNLQSQSDI